MFNHAIYISPRYQVSDYIDLNLRLDSNDETWRQAIDILKDRIENRFLLIIQDQLDKLRANFGIIDYSFSVMALNCLLIETMRQFKKGIDTTESNYRGANQAAFVEFFKQSYFFRDHFSQDTAKTFYKHIRCGILHQAQTQSNSQLTIDQDSMVERIENNCIRVDVEKFTYALFEDYEDYVSILNQRDKDTVYRRNFIKKMNHIVQGNRR
ncbi:hypothetical protein YDYSG_56970 [Paenibacillus tyrfis]|uniref:hypothetical protein n=1 Tax=Paenibacillus tyrfis TaxID=1501230 RepID=UPI002491B2F4|nr:hypothetical protein [Paenibacillus tyrfis]GLI09665.1 hypothetical protein YDYSG_56970 [Paenibacillus tyrfis]